MDDRGLDAVVLTSMHGIAYYSGFLHCAFGRPYACVVTPTRAVTVSANIDGGQPGRRSACETLVYTDWEQDSADRSLFGDSDTMELYCLQQRINTRLVGSIKNTRAYDKKPSEDQMTFF